ncbi:uncharacterized protein MKZ38_005112 [Zalerion maritima]|uniref:Uncharacterized protein n=1 Tax=Zalerion maritima TaxID=339359 RepID=A0AAD5RLN9_9PEZI|nr:uncharacterized protein MKZ38_005112 [Zalerion maritima]
MDNIPVPAPEPLEPRFWSGSTIFFAYLFICLSLALFAIRSIYTQSAKFPPQLKSNRGWPTKLLFATLAAISLSTTWYHMFMFFDWSFKDHLSSGGSEVAFASLATPPSPGDLLSASRSPEKLRAEAWLRNTGLFAQAWGAALDSDARAWWTLQIFPMATAWGMWLGREGARRKINLLTMLVLTFLGFLVAISFAMNLSLLVVLCSRAPRKRPTGSGGSGRQAHGRGRGRQETKTQHQNGGNPETEKEEQPSPWSPTPIDMILFANALFIPWTTSLLKEGADRPTDMDFMGPLLLLHVNVVLLVVGFWVMTGIEMAGFRVPGLLIALILVFPTLINKSDGVLDALGSHPAVTSVGWDVIMCWISVLAWSFIAADE